MRNTTIHLVLIPSRSLSPGVTITLPNTPCDHTLFRLHCDYLPARYLIRIANLIWHDCWSICFSIYVYVSLFPLSISLYLFPYLSLSTFYLCLTLLCSSKYLSCSLEQYTPESMQYTGSNVRTSYMYIEGPTSCCLFVMYYICKAYKTAEDSVKMCLE